MQLKNAMQLLLHILQAKVMNNGSSANVWLEQKCTREVWTCCKNRWSL